MSESFSPVPPLIRYSDLRQKEIINICTCRSLGRISDLELDPKTGSIQSLIAAGGGKPGWFFGKESESMIPWHKIIRVGADIILVEVSEDEMRLKTE